MYIRRDCKKDATYLSIAHNIVEDAPAGKRAKPIVFANLWPEDEISGEMASSMAKAFERYAAKRLAEAKGEAPARTLANTAARTRAASTAFRILATKELGMRLLVEAVWKDLGLDRALAGFAASRRFEFPLERLVFAMVLNRLVDPKSKLACNDWVKTKGYVPEGTSWQVQHFYRALDVLHEHGEEVEALVGDALAAQLSEAEKSFQLVDTTTLYFESRQNDREVQLLAEAWDDFDADGTLKAPRRPRPAVVNDTEFRMQGHNKDGHPGDPQVVIASLCAPGGLVLLHRVFPGNTPDVTVTKRLLAEFPPLASGIERVWVSDAGMASSSSWMRRAGSEPPQRLRGRARWARSS